MATLAVARHFQNIQTGLTTRLTTARYLRQKAKSSYLKRYIALMGVTEFMVSDVEGKSGRTIKQPVEKGHFLAEFHKKNSISSMQVCDG